MERKAPDRIYVPRRAEFNKLLEVGSPLAGKELKHIFMFALTIGYYEKLRIELPKQKEDLIRIEYLNDKEKCIIEAIAIESCNDINIILDKKKIYSIAEEFAAAGIGVLKNKIFGSEYGSFIKSTGNDCLEEVNKILSEVIEKID